MKSSYIENHYGDLLRTYVLGWRPVGLVELGVLDGYSTLHIARGIKENKRLYDIDTRLVAYDLFEDYAYNHGYKDEVENMLINEGVGEFVDLRKESAFEAYKNHEEKSIEFMHIDLSNTGAIIKRVMDLWHPKIKDRAIICIEGGSEERDNVEWMVKYGMPSIKKEIETNELINKCYIYGTYLKFPSMTILLKKWYED